MHKFVNKSFLKFLLVLFHMGQIEAIVSKALDQMIVLPILGWPGHVKGLLVETHTKRNVLQLHSAVSWMGGEPVNIWSVVNSPAVPNWPVD